MFPLVNQGTDSTLEPAYFADQRRGGDSGISPEDFEVLKALVKQLKDEVEGTVSEEYKDGLLYRVEILEQLVDELIHHPCSKIAYDTTANWDSQPDLIGEKGKVYIYSDAKEFDGQTLPRIKIGNGVSLLKTMYFIDQDIVHALENIVTVTQEEKDYWNDKVGCRTEGTTLQFYK